MKKTFIFIVVILSLFFSCSKDGEPIIDEFSFEHKVTYEYNAAIMCFELNYPGTVKVLTLHYSRNDNFSNETSVILEFDSYRHCYKARLTDLSNHTTYYYQLEVKDGIGSFCSETKSFFVNNNVGLPYELPYYQSFDDGIGSYYAQSLNGDQVWAFSSGCASMYGAQGLTPKLNRDILCSSPVVLKSVLDAKLIMTYRASGFSNINTEVKLKALKGYSFGADYWATIRETIPVSLEESNQWKRIEIPLTDFVGETITVAIYYESSNINSGKLEIKEMLIEEGTAVL